MSTPFTARAAERKVFRPAGTEAEAIPATLSWKVEAMPRGRDLVSPSACALNQGSPASLAQTWRRGDRPGSPAAFNGCRQARPEREEVHWLVPSGVD